MPACHVRSISLPSRSHPLTLNIEEQLRNLKASHSSSVCQKLTGLKDLYESVDDFLQFQDKLEEMNTEEKFQKKILNERIARLSGGIVVLQVGAQTQVELKDKQLRLEDALNATKAAIEEGVVVGGGCCLLRLSTKVDDIKELMDSEEQKIGAEIFKRALSYPARLIAKNAGVNGSVVINQVLSNDSIRYGDNAARDPYEDFSQKPKNFSQYLEDNKW